DDEQTHDPIGADPQRDNAEQYRDLGAGPQHDIADHNTCHRARRTDQLDGGTRIIGHEDEAADDTAEQIECEIAATAEYSLYIVAEHRQEDHVAHDVRNIRVEELARDDGEESRHPSPRGDVADEGGWRETERIDDAIDRELTRSHLEEQDREIECDQAPGNHRLHRRAEWIVVIDRDKHPKSPITDFVRVATVRRTCPSRSRACRRRRGNPKVD